MSSNGDEQRSPYGPAAEPPGADEQVTGEPVLPSAGWSGNDDPSDEVVTAERPDDPTAHPTVEPHAETDLPGYQPPPALTAPGPFTAAPVAGAPAAGAPFAQPGTFTRPATFAQSATFQQPGAGQPYLPVGAAPGQPYGTPYPPPVAAYPPQAWIPRRPTDGLAIAAISAGAGSLLLAFFFPLILIAAPVGLVLGIVALRRIGRSGAEGKALAITGIVTGGVGTLALVAGVVFLGFLFAALSSYH